MKVDFLACKSYLNKRVIENNFFSKNEKLFPGQGGIRVSVRSGEGWSPKAEMSVQAGQKRSSGMGTVAKIRGGRPGGPSLPWVLTVWKLAGGLGELLFFKFMLFYFKTLFNNLFDREHKQGEQDREKQAPR